MKVASIAFNTYREAIRNKVIYSVVLFGALLVGASALFGQITLGSTPHVIKDFGLFALSFFGAVITIILGVSLLNKELKQKTIYNILSKPISRGQFILGKHLGLTVTVILLVGLMGAGLMLFVSLFEGHIDWVLAQGIFLTLLEVSIVAAIAIFFSSLVVTTTLTGLFTLGTYIAGRSITYFSYFLEKGSEGYDPALAPILQILDWVLPDLSLFNASDLIVYGEVLGDEFMLKALLYTVSYCAVALILATLIFERRELT